MHVVKMALSSRSPAKPSFEQTGRLFALASEPLSLGAKPKQVSLPLMWSVTRKGDTLVLHRTNEDQLVTETTIACAPGDDVTVTHPEVPPHALHLVGAYTSLASRVCSGSCLIA